MSWKDILKEMKNCPNCGGEIKNYIDDPNDDAEPRCSVAVANKWKGKYQDCYPNFKSTGNFAEDAKRMGFGEVRTLDDDDIEEYRRHLMGDKE